MDHDVAVILEESLARLRAGDSVESCLARHPEHAQELRTLLELATAVQSLPRPAARPSAVEAGQRKVLAAVAQKGHAQRELSREASRRVTLRNLSRYAERGIAHLMGKEDFDMKLALRFTMIVLGAILILGGGTVTAVSASALPGDTLYSIKRGTENVRLLLTTNPDARDQLESQFENVRRQEVQAVLEDGRTVSVHFWGELTELGDTSYLVGGLPVILQADTEIEGQPMVGELVEVHALTQPDGTLVARSLKAHHGAANPTAVPGTTPTHEQEHDRDRDHAQATQEPTQQQQRDQEHEHQQATAGPTHEQERQRDQEHEHQQATAEPTHEQERQHEQEREHQQATAEPTHEQEQQHDQEHQRQQQATPQPTQGGGHHSKDGDHGSDVGHHQGGHD